MNDRELRDLRNSIVNLLNSANIPMEVKRLVVYEVYQTVDKKANEIIEEQTMEIAEIKENQDGN